MCWLDVGLGKTVVSLSAFSILQDHGWATCALVVAPLRVAQSVWQQEAAKWEHLRHLRVVLVLGDADDRKYALSRRADIYVINPDNLVWLLGYAKEKWSRSGLPWNMVIADEVTLYKNPTAHRSKALVALSAGAYRRVGLTGEPAANGYPDLFGQFRFVDGGDRLGKFVTDFRNAYLSSGPTGYGWICDRLNQERIRRRIQDITLEQSSLQCLGLPPVRRHEIWVDLPQKVRTIYDQMERAAFAELPSGATIEAVNAAGILNKLAQAASGAVYLGQASKDWEALHDSKLEALRDLVEESGGRPVLVGHTFVHERERLLSAFQGSVALDSGTSAADFADLLRRWKADQIPMLVLHPRSAGHGLNLQGSSARMAVWTSLPWSLELRNQFEGRLFGGHRRQGEGVIVEILARNTVDELIKQALTTKDGVQTGLKAAIRDYREKKNL